MSSPAKVGREKYSWVRMCHDDGDKAAADEERREGYKREVAWLTGSNPAAWQPKKRHRVGACRWLVDADNMLRQSTAAPGLHFFQIGDQQPQDHPARWPLLSLCADRGSDGTCAIKWLQRVRNVNCDEFYDQSHDVSNDLINALQRAGLAPLRLCLTACWDVPHGPWASQARWRQVIDGIIDQRELCNPATSPLWQRRAQDMLWDLGAASKVGDEDLEDWLWERSYDSGPWSRKGSKHNHSRFCNFAYRAKDEIKSWSCRLWGYESIALDESWLKGRLFTAFIMGRRADPCDDAVPEMKKENELDKQIRSACCNAIVFAILVLGNPEYKILTRGIVLVQAAWLKWHQEQNAKLRAVTQSLSWLAEQIRSNFLQTCRDTWETLSVAGLVWCGVAERPDELELNGDELNADHPAVGREDDLCQHLGNFALQLNAARLQRCLSWLVGWPGRTAAITYSTYVEGTIEALKLDYQHFLDCQASDDPVLQACADRSSFHLMPVKQIVELLKLEHWALSPEVDKFMVARNSRMISTVLIEDGFRCQRGVEDRRSNTVGANIQQFTRVLQSNVLDKRHHYIAIPPASRDPNTPSSLPDDAMCASVGTSPMKFRSIVSTSAKTSWYSPGPKHVAVEHADHAFLAYVFSNGLQAKARNVWLNCLLRYQPLVIRNTTTPVKKWYFVLAVNPGSATLVWPAVEEDLGDQAFAYFPDCSTERTSEVCFITVLDLSIWEAFVYTWRSPSYCALKYSCNARRLVAIPNAPPRPLLQVAAMAGFWTIPAWELKRLATHVGCPGLGDGMTSFDLAFSLVQHVLTLSDADTMAILQNRLAAWNDKCSAGICNSFLRIDEVSEIFDKEDTEAAQLQKKKIQDAKVEKQLFATAFKDKMVAIKDAEALAAARGRGRGGRGRGRGGPGGHPWGDRIYRSLPEGALTQAQAKERLPPGTSIWLSYRRKAWAGHCPPNSRISEPWHDSGECQRAAAASIIRQLWEQYLELKCKPLDSCPVPGLMSS